MSWRGCPVQSGNFRFHKQSAAYPYASKILISRHVVEIRWGKGTYVCDHVEWYVDVYDGKMSNTLMDERYKENRVHAERPPGGAFRHLIFP